MNHVPIFKLLVIGVLLYACNPSVNQVDRKQELLKDTIRQIVRAERGKTIFYNMPGPVEMSDILEDPDAKFHSEFLAPLDELGKYMTLSEQALALGIYGVDLGYIKQFNQTQYVLNYFAAVNRLAKEIGIPVEQTKKVIHALENNSNRKELLIDVMTEFFNDADKYLLENDRESASSLILLGGWIEAMYLACNITNSEPVNINLLNQIANQKYTLSTLFELLMSFNQEKSVNRFFEPLLALKKVYNQVDITKRNNVIDKSDSKTSYVIEKTEETVVTKSQLNEINRIVVYMRDKIME